MTPHKNTKTCPVMVAVMITIKRPELTSWYARRDAIADFLNSKQEVRPYDLMVEFDFSLDNAYLVLHLLYETYYADISLEIFHPNGDVSLRPINEGLPDKDDGSEFSLVAFITKHVAFTGGQNE